MSEVILRDAGICSDGMASCFKPPRPASVSSVIEHIEFKYDESQITKIDLSCNNLRYEGLMHVLRYIDDNIPNLEELDVSYNRINRDDIGNESYGNI